MDGILLINTLLSTYFCFIICMGIVTKMCLRKSSLLKNVLPTVPNKSKLFYIYYMVHFVILQVYWVFLATLSNEYLFYSWFLSSLFLVAMTTELKCVMNR